MIKFFKKSCLKLYFNKLQDIFPEFCLFKNKARYSFKDDGALNRNMIQPPTIKVK